MRRFDQINVIPFIDIMLVALAIVLTSASFIAQGKIPLDLPEADAATPLSSSDAVQIAVDHGGQVYLDDEAIDGQALGARLDTLDHDRPVVLRVDAGARFDAFVAVVDLLKARQLHNLTIVTRPSS